MRLRQQPGHRAADDDQRVARPAGAEGDRRSSPPAPAPPTAASTPWPATRPARWACPTTSAGSWKSKAGIPIVCVPGCPIQPDNLSETLTYLLYMATDQAPMIPLDEALRPDLAVRPHRARGLRPRRLLRAGRLRHRVRLPQVHRQARLLGPGGQVQRAQARVDQRHRRLPERRRHLHRLHHAGLPDKFMPFMDEPPGGQLSTNVVPAWGSTLRKLRSALRAPSTKNPSGASPVASSSPAPSAPGNSSTPTPAREVDVMTSTTSHQ